MDDALSGELPLDGKPPQKFFTHDVMKALWNKYTENGQYVVMFDVPDHVGMDGRRRADAIACGMWRSTSHRIIGFEIKASRSDWLRELKDVSKADPFIERCDEWWLVTAGADIAKLEEIPPLWGWQNLTKSGLRLMKKGHKLRGADEDSELKRSFAFALIKAAAARQSKDTEEFRQQVAAAVAVDKERLERDYAYKMKSISPEFEALRERVEQFERASGMSLSDYSLGSPESVGKIAAALHEWDRDGYHGMRKRLARHLEDLDDLAKRTKVLLEAVNAR